MPFTDTQEYIESGQGGDFSVQPDFGDVDKRIITLRPGHPFAEQDVSIIVHAFEVECSNWDQEDYALAYHYRDVYSTHNFSERVQEQMSYYPGMHQTTSGVPAEDPFYTNAKEMADDRLNYWNNAMDSPDAFMGGLRGAQKDFDYSTIFGSDVSAKDRAHEIGKMITECVPCFDRLLDGMNLLPDGDLLEIHALNIKIRTDILDKLKELFRDPGAFLDICELLKLLSHMCPKDLLAILALLTQYLAKLNLDVKFNLDFIIQLVGPIMSPFLDALSQWLDKWIQMILGPIICVVDHINETILLAQQVQIPFSEVSGNIEMDIGVAAPAHQNASTSLQQGGDVGLGDPSKGIFEEGAVGPHAGGWAKAEVEHFETPDSEKYNASIPDYPIEETQMAREEVAEAWSPSFSEAEREERNARWQELRSQELEKRHEIPAPLRQERRDGTRWSKDDIPNSEKHTAGAEWEKGYHPPEKQGKPGEATEYFVTTPIVDSIVQMRNILQGAIQYIKDWFTYITQMIYDLLGTDFGWMQKKADNTMLKQRIIRLIMMVKSILEAVAKNGLECGTHSNFNPAQLKYILEEELSRFTATRFQVLDNGDIYLTPAAKTTIPDIDIPGPTPDDGVTPPEKPADKQKSVESGIIIKDCLKDVGADELEEVRSWIAEFEKRGGVND